MIMDYESINEYLHDELSNRVGRNARYSLRAFAKALRINPAELSQVLKGQRKLSLNSAFKVTQSLGFTPTETKHFLLLLQKEKGRSLGLPLEFLNSTQQSQAETVALADFDKIGEWYHFAILNLMDTKNFQWTAAHISQRLGITATEAKLAMRNLERTGFVTFSERSPLTPKAHWDVGSQIPSQTIRRYHRQILAKASDALESVPVAEREFQSLGLVIKHSDMKRLKAEIDQFTETIRAKFHRAREEQVYQLEIALFPLTQESSSNDKK